jgi:ferredoxin
MNNTIYWFSGTGNSLYAAKQLAAKLSDAQLVSMAHSVPASEPIGGEGCKIGFVFPSYYGDLPRLVRSFAEKLNIHRGTDLFAVVTMGAFGQGSVGAMDKLLADKGLSLRYGVGLRMPANYILKYDPAMFGAKSAERLNKKLDKADRKICRIADDILSGKHQVKTNSITAKTLYTDIAALDSAFMATEKCTGCGLCAKVCPVGNIRLADGKPEWRHRCEHCVACISWCPAAAIEYGEATKKRMRYRNPRVRAVELENVSHD